MSIVRKKIVTIPTTSGFQLTSGKVFQVQNTMTLLSAGDSSVITLPNSTDTLMGLATIDTVTGTKTFNKLIRANNALTVASNAITVPVTYNLNTITNNANGAVTITMTTAGATDGQITMIRFYDFSASAQTLTWVNTENSTVSVPATSNGSTTLPSTVWLQYNSATSKWRCIMSV